MKCESLAKYWKYRQFRQLILVANLVTDRQVSNKLGDIS